MRKLNDLPSDYSAIYLRFMEEYRYNKEFKGDSKDNESDFKYSILVLLAEVMNADGKLLTSELDRVKSTIRRYFHNESEQNIEEKTTIVQTTNPTTGKTPTMNRRRNQKSLPCFGCKIPS